MLLQVLQGNEAQPEEKISIEDDVGKAIETAPTTGRPFLTCMEAYNNNRGENFFSAAAAARPADGVKKSNYEKKNVSSLSVH
jgi:hypothetical protein